MINIRDRFQYQSQRFVRLVSSWRQKGHRHLAKRLWEYCKDLVYLRFDGYLLEMSPPWILPLPPCEIDYTVIELKEPMDLSHLIKDLTYDNVAYRLKRGEHCFVAMLEQRAIGSLWFTNKTTYFPGFEFRVVSKDKWIHLDPDTAYVYRGAVEKKYYGHRIITGIMNVLTTRALELGIKTMINSQGFNNIAVRKASMRHGWHVKALVSCHRICMITFRYYFPLEYIHPSS